MTELRKDLPALPRYFHRLPIDDRGYPVPFFVAWIDGKPDFRVADGVALRRCVKEKICWLCGQPLGRNLAWVIGPMCAVNRVSSEPPQHLECADFAARACPFLARPKAKRREANLPTEDISEAAGDGLRRNPGVALVWVARNFSIIRVDGTAPGTTRGILFQVGDPIEMRWYAEGRIATAAEVHSSIYSGLPLLLKVAQAEGPKAEYALAAKVAIAAGLMPKAA